MDFRTKQRCRNAALFLSGLQSACEFSNLVGWVDFYYLNLENECGTAGYLGHIIIAVGEIRWYI